jgi:hypothetical protein
MYSLFWTVMQGWLVFLLNNVWYSSLKMRPIDCLETSVTKHLPMYHLIRAKTRTQLTLSKSVSFEFFIPYHLALEMKVKNIAKQTNDKTFFSDSTRQKFLLLLNADYEVQIGNRSRIV